MINRRQFIILLIATWTNDKTTRNFKILKVIVSQAITETPRAMSKKYTRISKSHIVKRIVETKFHSAIFLENYSPRVSSFENFHILEMFTSLRSTREWSQSSVQSAKRMQISHDALRVAVQSPLRWSNILEFRNRWQTGSTWLSVVQTSK